MKAYGLAAKRRTSWFHCYCKLCRGPSIIKSRARRRARRDIADQIGPYLPP